MRFLAFWPNHKIPGSKEKNILREGQEPWKQFNQKITIKQNFTLGLLDQHPVQKKALLPMGEGKFILPLNLSMRRAIGKGAGDNLTVQMEEDRRDITPSADFMKCLRDEPRALAHFKSLPGAHQRYFSKWIEEAKTIHTKTKRITMAVIALASNQGFPEMMRSQGNLRG